MSRIGKLPIAIPSGVTVNIKGDTIAVKGPKGELTRTLPPDMSVKMEGSNLLVMRPDDTKQHKAFHGLARSLLANMVDGVSKGFEKTLEIVGVGFRAEKTGNNLTLRLGFSHPVEVKPLPGITLGMEGTNRIKVSGIDKEVVGEMAAEIRAIRTRDIYKGKGIKYAGELVHLKPGKAGKAVGRTT
jgi:large subunit ribosomal protein L6